MTPAEQLKAARAAAGLTQRQAAERSGVPLRTLEQWEIGRRRPPGYVLRLTLDRLASTDRAPAHEETDR